MTFSVGDDTPGETASASDFARRRGVVRGAASSYLAQAIGVVTGFLVTPLVLHHIGREHFGLWVLIGALVSYGTLLDLGISSGVVKYVAEHLARGRVDEARAVATTALWIYGAFGLLVILLASAASPFVPAIFGIDAEDRQLAIALTVLSGIGVGVGIPFSTPRAVLRGLQRFELANLISIAATLLTAAAIVAVVVLGGGLLELVAATVATTFVMQPISIWIVRRTAPSIGYGWRGGRRDLIRPLLGFSSSVWVMQVAGRLLGRSDTVIIGLFLPVASVTPYALAQRVSTLVYMGTNEMTKVLMPLSSEMQASDAKAALRSTFLISTRLTLAAGAGFAVVVATLGPEILTVWVGEQYAHYSTIVTLLAFGIAADALSLPAGNILVGMGRPRVLAAMAIGAGVADVVLSVVLLHLYGLVGVAVATLVPMAFVSVFVRMPYAARAIGVTLTRVARSAVLPVVLPSAALTAALGLLTRAARIDSLLELLLAGGGGLAAYVALYVLIGASRGERAFYRSYVRRVLPNR